MRRIAQLMMVFVLMALVLLAGCQGPQPAKRPVADFREVQLADAPPDVVASYEQLKSVPGLYVLSRDNLTYLLLVGGKMTQSGMRISVLDVQKSFGGPKDVRILAALRPDPVGGTYPYALLELDGGAGLNYKARLSLESGDVLELQGTPIVTE